jgi:hypothetical protein
MAFITNFDQSNSADWTFAITATDAETGEAIDFTGAEVALAVKDDAGRELLAASLDDGITQPDANTLLVSFGADLMEDICPGTYKIGCVYALDGATVQLLTGTVSIYDGVATL